MFSPIVGRVCLSKYERYVPDTDRRVQIQRISGEAVPNRQQHDGPNGKHNALQERETKLQKNTEEYNQPV